MYQQFTVMFLGLPIWVRFFLIPCVIMLSGLCIGVVISSLMTSQLEVQPIVQPTVQPVSPPITPESSVQLVMSVDEQTKYRNAITRLWKMDKLCYDEKKEYWFLHIPANMANTTDDDDEPSDHWFFTEHRDIEVIELSNNTIAITNPLLIFTTEVWPDVTGLNCTDVT